MYCRPEVKKIWLKFRIHFSQAYKYVRKSQISAGRAGSNITNVVMQQETSEALNELANDVSYDCETIEHINATNSRLSGQVKKSEELICALQL